MAQKQSSSLIVVYYSGDNPPTASKIARADVVIQNLNEGHFKVIKTRSERSQGQVYPNGYMSIYLQEQQEIKNGTSKK